MHDFTQFLAWEATTRDTIDFKTAYVDMAGDLIAGLLLSQIVYWHLPNAQGASKLRVEKDGRMWIAKKRTDWWDEIRITGRQFDRAVAVLEEKGLVETEVYRFDGAPTKHIRLCQDRFLSVFTENVKSNSPKGEDRSSQDGENITETTSETTAESPPNGAQAPPPPTSLSGWLDLVRESSNRPATLRWMVSVIYPYLTDSDLPDYGYVGKVAKEVGGAGLLATLLWENAKHAPQGNVVSYVYQAHRNGQGKKHTQGGRSNGGNARSSPGRRQSDWQARDPAELHERNKQQLAWMLEKHARWRQEREAT